MAITTFDTMRDDELAHWRDHCARRLARLGEEGLDDRPALTPAELAALSPAMRRFLVARGDDRAQSGAALTASTAAYLGAVIADADAERAVRRRYAHVAVTSTAPRFPATWLADLKARFHLDGVIELETGIALGPRSSAGQRRGPCPFCGSRGDALAVYLAEVAHERWYCFRCTRHGDLIHAIEIIYDVPFRAAVEILAARANVALPPGFGPRPAPAAPDRYLGLSRGDGDA